MKFKKDDSNRRNNYTFFTWTEPDWEKVRIQILELAKAEQERKLAEQELERQRIQEERKVMAVKQSRKRRIYEPVEGNS